jgi:glycerol kinase
MVETTALGAASLAGLTCGLWSTPEELRELQKVERRFEPRLAAAERGRFLHGWRRAVRAAAAWAADAKGEADESA